MRIRWKNFSVCDEKFGKWEKKTKLKSARESTSIWMKNTRRVGLFPNGLTNVLPLNVWINYQINVASSRNSMMKIFILYVKTRSPFFFRSFISLMNSRASSEMQKWSTKKMKQRGKMATLTFMSLWTVNEYIFISFTWRAYRVLSCKNLPKKPTNERSETREEMHEKGSRPSHEREHIIWIIISKEAHIGFILECSKNHDEFHVKNWNCFLKFKTFQIVHAAAVAVVGWLESTMYYFSN